MELLGFENLFCHHRLKTASMFSVYQDAEIRIGIWHDRGMQGFTLRETMKLCLKTIQGEVLMIFKLIFYPGMSWIETNIMV